LRRWWSRLDPVLVTMVVGGLVVVLGMHAYYVFRDPEPWDADQVRGLPEDEPRPRVAVMRKVKIPQKFIEANVTGRVEACHGSPSGTPIGEPQG
jgi:hypothetical protein